MKLYGLTLLELEGIVAEVSRNNYKGNLELNRAEQSPRGRVDWTLRVKRSRDPGAHRSWSGRRTVAACWHAHRDVMAAVFERNPAARIVSSFADYEGRERFEREFPGTYYHQVGSMMQPADYGELCDCEE